MIIDILLAGCDDNTEFSLEIEESELDVIRRISERSQETSYMMCMPALLVKMPNENYPIRKYGEESD